MEDPKRIGELFQPLEDQEQSLMKGEIRHRMERITSLFRFLFGLCHALKNLSVHFDGHGKDRPMRWTGLSHEFIFDRRFQFVQQHQGVFHR